MSQIKELIIGKKADEIFSERQNWKRKVPAKYDPTEFQRDCEGLRSFVGKIIDKKIGPDDQLYISGHQPEIFHPGLLSKEIVLHQIAKKHNSIPIHIVVDTDISEFIWTKWELNSENWVVGKFEYSSETKKVFCKDDLPKEKKDELKKEIITQKEFYKLLHKENIESSHFELFDQYLTGLDSSEPFYKLNESIRTNFLQKKGVQIPNIYLSELVKTPEFLSFYKKMENHLESFCEIYNESLEEYRKEHKIKNHAQPFPNLKEKEMPFWDLDESSGIRNPIQKGQKVFNPIPKAVTLTMFLRIFIADFFIHGTGGVRYESVSDRIIQKFFGIEACPYIVTTATLNYEKPKDFVFSDLKDLEKKQRELVFSPEKYLPENNELVIKKRELQKQFSIPSVDKKKLNEEISQLNEKMKELTKEELLTIEKEILNYPLNQKKQEFYQTRTFPFFYYRIAELFDIIQKEL